VEEPTTEPIVDKLLEEQRTGPLEDTVELETELIDESGNTTTQKRAVLAGDVTRAQMIIAAAESADKAEQDIAIEEAVQLLYPYPPREGQRDALRQLIYQKTDLILIAKTSFGNQIGQEQTEYITRIGGKPCFLNADSINTKVLEEVEDGKYTHILISPELAVSEKFHKTATNPKFIDRLSLVVIDEAHLVSQWGRSFRTDYARLSQLRGMFGDRIPWFACSATLDDKTLNDLKTGAGFGNDVAVIRTSIDRPELAWRIGLIPKGSQAQGSALRFLFDKGKRPVPEASPAPQEIPKTIAFFDSKKEAYTALDGCRNWLLQSEQHRYSKKQVKVSIKVFHRDIAKFDKEAILVEFQRPAKDSSIRVIFATEALGLGVNLPDVRRVVQYCVPNGNEPAIV
jgi:hypothetical protein